MGFAEAVASEQEDFRVLHQAIGDGGGDGGVVEDVALRAGLRTDDGARFACEAVRVPRWSHEGTDRMIGRLASFREGRV